MTMKRIAYLLDRGVFKDWLTDKGVDAELRKFALFEVIVIYDHSFAVKLGAHLGGAIQVFGTKRHHDKWLRNTENYAIMGCFAMSELGHGSNVRAIETVTTYDSNTGEFVISTPCESAQKYWIGAAANRFAAFMAPLTWGRVTIAVSAVYSSQISIAIAIRYSLTRPIA
ncbi:acyl-coenzyme A oxidase 3 [Pyrus ussuriensis x Pyrus communis]|uniref:Acyl-coenzyme A oxidase 3 n=1 Tax=Pyrus ussuriensis x Pyrus communis TaxID=2448454 RepID=A0A5N5GB70_9ROSA|nr:acyl-coenzyme A oxidase 3 [Pyrus ussuriensis x Pyrus communis]